MKNTVLASVVLCGTIAAAEKPPAPAKAAETSRSVQVSEKSVVSIRTSVSESTLIVLPEGEKVMQAFAGNTEDWRIDSTKEPSRYISIKPKVAASSTDLHVVTDHGNDYSFLLKEASGTADLYDVKVFLEADGEIKSNLSRPAEFVSAKELAQIKAEADKAKTDAEKAVATANAKQLQSAESFRAAYPSKLHFGYRWDEKAGAKLGIEQMFDDGKFTYIKAHPQETPTLYEVKDGKPSLINFDFANGLYTVPKLLTKGYLAIGKQKVEFSRAPEPEIASN